MLHRGGVASWGGALRVAPVNLQRAVAFCVREARDRRRAHGGVAVAAVGLGLDGYYDVQACVRLPGMSRSVGFSLSWAVWEVVFVLRDLEGEGAIMLVHVAIMLSAFYIVFALGCMEHMIACNQLQEASTILLNPRLLWMELVGKEKALKSRRFRRLTAGFGALFLLVRIGFALPRTPGACACSAARSPRATARRPLARAVGVAQRLWGVLRREHRRRRPRPPPDADGAEPLLGVQDRGRGVARAVHAASRRQAGEEARVSVLWVQSSRDEVCRSRRGSI